MKTFFVVWNGDDNTGSLLDDENEIFGQRIDGLTGLEKGTDDLRISDMGDDGDAKYDGEHPGSCPQHVQQPVPGGMGWLG